MAGVTKKSDLDHRVRNIERPGWAIKKFQTEARPAGGALRTVAPDMLDFLIIASGSFTLRIHRG